MKQLAVSLVLLSLLLTACSSAPTSDSESTSHVAITTPVDGKRFESPNGEYMVVTDGEVMYHRVVITSKRGQSAEMVQTKWVQFVGWTADSRYAIVNYYDQYGNQLAVGFDTSTWSQFFVAPFQSNTACMGHSTGKCGLGAVAIAPSSSRVLLRAGIVVDLVNSTENQVLCDLSEDSISLAAWSPDEQYLAFVAYQWFSRGPTHELFLVKDDLTQPERIAPVARCSNSQVCSLSWAADGQSILVKNEFGRRVFLVVDGQVVSVPEPEEVPVPEPEKEGP